MRRGGGGGGGGGGGDVGAGFPPPPPLGPLGGGGGGGGAPAVGRRERGCCRRARAPPATPDGLRRGSVRGSASRKASGESQRVFGAHLEVLLAPLEVPLVRLGLQESGQDSPNHLRSPPIIPQESSLLLHAILEGGHLRAPRRRVVHWRRALNHLQVRLVRAPRLVRDGPNCGCVRGC